MESCLHDYYVANQLHHLLVVEHTMKDRKLPQAIQLPLYEDSIVMVCGPQARMTSEMQIIIAFISTNKRSYRCQLVEGHDAQHFSTIATMERVFQSYMAR